MGKCLVTELDGRTNNSNLLCIGETRIKFSKVSNPTATTQCVTINVLRDTKLEIIGDGYFTDSSLSQNNGKNLTITANLNNEVYVSNNDIELAVLDKYAIIALKVKSGYNGSISFNIKCLKHSTSINYIYLDRTKVSGDIAALKNLTALTYLSMSPTQVSGDIAALKNLTALTYLSMSSTQVSGDIAALKNLTALVNLSMSSTQISGDIAALKNLTALTYLSMSSTQVSGDIAALKNLTALSTIDMSSTQVRGDIAALKNLTKLASIEFKNVTGLTGDIGTLPDGILFFPNNEGNFTWTTSSRTYILATEGIKCDRIDDMLNDMATKTAKFAGDEAWYKTISLIGTRTSASDAAVQTLQTKGYTVSITPA